jgi:hypothetical protein
MKSSSLQDLVRNIFSSEAAKKQFMADPDSIISQFELTDNERKAILNVHARLGLDTGNSTHLTALDLWF